MRKLVNLYIMMFFLDAILSLADVVVVRCFGIHPFYIVRGIVSFIPFVLAIPLYLIMGCMRGFPRKVLLPFVLFVIWATLFMALPLPFFMGFKNTELALSLAQLVLGGVALLALRLTNSGGGWLYERSAFEQLAFRWPRLFGFVAANVFVIAPLLVVYMGVSLSMGISHLSQGFIHLNPKGLCVEARTYQYNDKEILLLPTAHIAKHSFYTDLIKGLPSGKTVVIPEGVSDDENRLAEGMNYDKLAPKLGLVAQDTEVLIAKHPTNRCDIDISSLSPEVINYLNAVGALSRGLASDKPLEAFLKYIVIPQPDMHVLWQEVVLDRNRLVADCIFKSLESFDCVAVPWGAGHMPGIEKAVLEAGAIMVESRRVWVLKWAEAGLSKSNISTRKKG